MSPERKRGAAREKPATNESEGRGTFANMFAEERPEAATQPEGAWTRPRPVAEDLSRELSPVLERDYDHRMLNRVFDALDYVVPTLTKTNDQAIYMLMVRRSYGRGKKTCLVNLPLFAERSNLSISGVQYAIRRLSSRELIKSGKTRLGRGTDQGVEYEVFIPTGR